MISAPEALERLREGNLRYVEETRSSDTLTGRPRHGAASGP